MDDRKITTSESEKRINNDGSSSNKDGRLWPEWAFRSSQVEEPYGKEILHQYRNQSGHQNNPRKPSDKDNRPRLNQVTINHWRRRTDIIDNQMKQTREEEFCEPN